VSDARIDRFLKPGEQAVGDARHRLRTLLGSCVSITLWQPQRLVGAMSHFLLPRRQRPAVPGHKDALDARYGDEALALMVQGLAGLGIDARQCVARLFGGGDMFPDQRRPPRAWPSGNVGRRNGEAARALLQQLGVPVASEHLFGAGHRRITFDIATGEVQSHQVRPGEPALAQPPATQPAALPTAFGEPDPMDNRNP
jgi:chemotaxis protein CheD